MEKKRQQGPIIITPMGRLSWPYLFKVNSEGDYPSGKYEAELIIPKTLDIQPMVKAALEMLHREEAPNTRKLSETAHPPIKDGDKKDFEGNHGHWIIKAKNKIKPVIVGVERGPDGKFKPFDNPEEHAFPGANARLSINPYYYSKKGGGIGWSLRGVQIFPGGERFAGIPVKPENEFPEEDEAEAPKNISEDF